MALLFDILHGFHFHHFIAIKSSKVKMQEHKYVHFVFIYKSS